MSQSNYENGKCNFLNCYKSLLRVRGEDGLECQIEQLENDWISLLDDVRVFIADINEMKKQNRLFVGTRTNRNYRQGKFMGRYKQRKMYIPYLCFLMKGNVNVFKWEPVSRVLAARNATFDEIALHMWVYRGMRDYYWRASAIADKIENLLNYRNECEEVLSLEQIDRSMLPNKMLRADDEYTLPGY